MHVVGSDSSHNRTFVLWQRARHTTRSLIAGWNRAPSPRKCRPTGSAWGEGTAAAALAQDGPTPEGWGGPRWGERGREGGVTPLDRQPTRRGEGGRAAAGSGGLPWPQTAPVPRAPPRGPWGKALLPRQHELGGQRTSRDLSMSPGTRPFPGARANMLEAQDEQGRGGQKWGMRFKEDLEERDPAPRCGEQLHAGQGLLRARVPAGETMAGPRGPPERGEERPLSHCCGPQAGRTRGSFSPTLPGSLY